MAIEQAEARHFSSEDGVVEAMQWDGTRQSGRQIATWATRATRCGSTPVYVNESRHGAIELIVRTSEGKRIARPGDWIVKGEEWPFCLVGERAFRLGYTPVGESHG